MSAMRDQLAALGRLRATDETWQVARRKMPAWIAPPGQAPYRPYHILCVSCTGPLIIFHEILKTEPSPEQVLDALMRGMQVPASRAGPPRRPQSIHFEEGVLVEALSPILSALDIRCEQRAIAELDGVVRELERHLTGREPLPGLLEAPGVTAEQVAGLFSAAAFFYREAPWRWLTDAQPLAVCYPPTAKPRYAVVMGHGGETFGLAVHDSWADLQLLYGLPIPEMAVSHIKATSLLYDGIMAVPFADLDMIEAHGWEVAGEDAYPIPIIMSQRGYVGRPGRQDILWFEAVLRAIPVFVRDYLCPSGGRLQPAEATLTVPVVSGEASVALKFPVST